MVSVKTKGDHDKTTKFLRSASFKNPTAILERYGQLGVERLMEATPRATGLTANSWYYEVVKGDGQYYLNFGNSNVQNGLRVAVILDVGHGTGNGGYVRGRDYIDPAIRPIFEQIAAAAWKEVTDAK